MPKKANLRKKRQAERLKLAAELVERQTLNRRFQTTRRNPQHLPELGVAALGIAAVAASILRNRRN